MRTKWPDDVPVLTGKDFCRGRRDGRGVTHSLLGWVYKIFGIGEVGHSARNALYEAIDGDEFSPIIDFNNDRKNSLPTLAKIWNQAMRSLGYTETFWTTKAIVA